MNRVPNEMTTFARLFAVLVPRSLLAAEAPLAVPSNDAVLVWMNQIAQQQRQKREETISQIRTVAEASVASWMSVRKSSKCWVVHLPTMDR
jgi:hypothetical protein